MSEHKSEQLKSKRKNDRKCIAGGVELGPRDPAIRFVLSPSGEVVIDLAEKLPGRGAWIRAEREAFFAATKQGAFSRAFKCQVDQKPEAETLLAFAETELRKRALNALGLVRKTGAMVSGFEKVRAGLKKGSLLAYVHAADGANDGVMKLTNLVMALDGPCQIIGCFEGITLDRALGMDNVVHIGLKGSGPSSLFLKETARLQGILPSKS